MVDLNLDAGLDATLEFPPNTEAGVYVVDGSVAVGAK